jgi:hypothetical protein
MIPASAAALVDLLKQLQVESVLQHRYELEATPAPGKTISII